MYKHIILGLLALTLGGSLAAAPFWTNFRHSGNIGNEVFANRVEVRCDFSDSNATLQSVEYRNEDGIVVGTMQAFQDGYAAPPSFKHTVSYAFGNPSQIGFRQVRSDGAIEIAPVKYSGTQPDVTDMSQCGTDPAGDALFNVLALDLTGYAVTWNEDKLFFALTNNSNSFPVNSGFTFYSYMAAIVDPDNPSPTQTAYGLLYTINQAGIISPGLYKINGTGISDMDRIGDITATTAAGSNILYLSCNWADLLADADFAGWYNTSGRIACMGLTQKITLTSGALEADRTNGVNVYPVNEQYTWVENQLPVLSGYTAYSPVPEPGEDPVMFIEIGYSDADGDFPLQTELVFDSGQAYTMAPLTYDYSGTVTYRNTDVSASFYNSSVWQTLTLRFWYTESDSVEYVVSNTANSDPVAVEPSLVCSTYPNPFADKVIIQVDNPKAQVVKIALYNLKGQLVRSLCEGIQQKGTQAYTWDGTDAQGAKVSSGMYLIKATSDNKTYTAKTVIAR